MLTDKIDLYEYFGIERKANGGYLNVYVPAVITEIKPKLRPAILVIAGGAYVGVSQRESGVVALKYAVNGYSAFTLEYSVNVAYPVPLLEACMAVIYIRQNAAKYNVDVNHVAAIGFSAGGHLAAMLANLYREKEITAVLGDKADLAKLNAVILSYPVITMGEYTHSLSRDVITGGNKKLIELLSMEKRVTESSPPAFIWHTYEDDCVPMENALAYANACRKAGVPFALHVFEKGRHGLSLCSEETSDNTSADIAVRHVGKWFELSLDWLNSRGFSVKTVATAHSNSVSRK